MRRRDGNRAADSTSPLKALASPTPTFSAVLVDSPSAIMLVWLGDVLWVRGRGADTLHGGNSQ